MSFNYPSGFSHLQTLVRQAHGYKDKKADWPNEAIQPAGSPMSHVKYLHELILVF